ncbi:hypothetical protein CC1G_15367 [Coprinopsis cinerea okayama7|uniref:Uncharacterized protein n=1 Tax=Coprinopsis cinerea (strain Okayama-7 / 130 / ATCC MYA-4618 / FGSC 9003) TaxID=240176 RepID=D6RQR1_COPC7|nr:hypothetical protein CC1G_15367 [Coprinopsis cinerea okayama7\|eukprot:XP_002910089.1 hypothetical protein CC1G_15367 [Coprinopsis cinerea okayama7\
MFHCSKCQQDFNTKHQSKTHTCHSVISFCAEHPTYYNLYPIYYRYFFNYFGQFYTNIMFQKTWPCLMYDVVPSSPVGK